MAAITTRFGSGGANLVPGGSGGQPSLADALRDIADDVAASSAGVVPAWSAPIAVVANVAVLATAGLLMAVDAVVAGAAGPKAQMFGAPGAGQVQVAYAGTGIPTLTFPGADAVTSIRVQQITRPASYTVLTTKA